MLNIPIRPSGIIINKISKLERLLGQNERIELIINEDKVNDYYYEAAYAACLLDCTFTAETFFIEQSKDSDTKKILKILHKNRNPSIIRTINNVYLGFKSENDIDIVELHMLYERVIEQKNTFKTTDSDIYRTESTKFELPFYLHNKANLFAFPAINSFLIRQRLEELFFWFNDKTVRQNNHPLFMIAIFHLLFLQIHPFPTANHRIALICLSKLLNEFGYSTVTGKHIINVIMDNAENYFHSLKQAEKSTYTSWNSINIWFEFIIDCLLKCLKNKDSKDSLNKLKLTNTQKRILEAIYHYKAASRMEIAKHTNITISTIKYNLAILEQENHITRFGAGRSTKYSLSE